MILAAYQGLCADGQVEANIAKSMDLFDQATRARADFLLMPETYLSGYGSNEIVEAGAMSIDDPRLGELIAHTGRSDTVLILGMCERDEGAIYNTALILQKGCLLGRYRKTMLTGSDHREMGFGIDLDLPVWRAKGVTFGVIICADSSYIEVAQTMWWKGARIIFSPHYNSIDAGRMDDHRIRVRNNHRGMAALLQVPVVRSNVVNWDKTPRLGYGDTAIYDSRGHPVAEAGLFTEGLIVAEVDLAGPSTIGTRLRIPMEVRRQLSKAMLSAGVAEL